MGMQRCSGSFPFPVEFLPRRGPTRRAHFTREGNSATILHAYGAALDHSDLTVFCVVGDGEAETGALAASWRVNKLINPGRDGTVIPILHLNGYKIANPTLLARIPAEDLHQLLQGYGYAPR